MYHLIITVMVSVNKSMSDWERFLAWCCSKVIDIFILITGGRLVDTYCKVKLALCEQWFPYLSLDVLMLVSTFPSYRSFPIQLYFAYCKRVTTLLRDKRMTIDWRVHEI